MITISKTGEGYYLVSLQGKPELLGKNSCLLIKNEILVLMKPHREISLDFKGVIKIDPAGYEILHELKSLMDEKKCKLRFINIDSSISKKSIGIT
jgi:anti-anti-sigma regulatory factor